MRPTVEIDVMKLIKENCPNCEMAIVPPDSEGELDIYRCEAAGGKHCLVAVTTPQCVKKPLNKA